MKRRAEVIANSSFRLMPAIMAAEGRGPLLHGRVEGHPATAARQAAVEALIMAAEGRGPLLHARVGMLRAMNHGHERVLSDRKETHWGKRKLKRDA